MFWYLAWLVVVAWAAAVFWQGRKVRQAAKQFKNDIPAWPVIGHSHHWIGSGEDRMKAFSEFGMEAVKQGGLSTIWLGQQFFLTLADPENAEFLLKACLEKDQKIMRFTQLVTGNGLIFAPVSIWRPRRKILAPIFSQKTLNGFVEVFERQSAVLVDQLRAVADGTDFSIWKYFTTFTLDSVCETNLGIRLNAQYNGHPFVDAFETGSQLVAQRMLQPWLHNDFVYQMLRRHKQLKTSLKYMFDFVDQIVHAKRIELNEQKTSSNSAGAKTFLEMLIEASGGEMGFTDLELREEVLVMIMAGTDTSAVGTSFATVLLSRFPEEQQKIYEEISEVFGETNRTLTFEDLPRLKYLEAFLKETLRMYPPVPVTTREVHQDVKLPTGETVVAGMSVCLHIWAMHRNPRYWGADAEQFRPARFLEGGLRHPAQFIPFSYGMRNCIGYQYAMMSMKTVMASLVRRYRVLPPAGMARAQLAAPLRVKYEIMMKHVDDYVVRLQNRSSEVAPLVE